MKFDTLRALRHRNFRLYFFGQGVSLMGTWMTRLATSWLVYRLTGSSVLLGVVGFAGQIPTFLLGPVAGVWVDRCDRRLVIMVTQVLAAAQSLALAGLVLFGHITTAEIIWLSIFQGVINAFDLTARQSFLVQMVGGTADLGNAIALNSTLVNVARVVGPALAGVTIGLVGEGYCFLIDGISYFAVIASLIAMRVGGEPPPKPKTTMLVQLREGWSYVSTFLPIRTVMLLFAIISFMGVPYSVLLPVFAAQILHGGPHTLGLLSGAAGLGALASALTLAGRKSIRGYYRLIPISAVLMGVGLAAFAYSSTLWLSLLFLVFAGYWMIMAYSASSTVIQTIVDNEKRGRVMGYWMMCYMGASPLGSLLAGALAPMIGVPGTVALCGSGCIFGGIWFWLQLPRLRPIIRPIYVRLGILPADEGPPAQPA